MPKTKTSFKPGQSGNLKGRPKADWTWSGLLREVAEQMKINKLNGVEKPRKQLIAEALADEAEKGNVQAIKEFGDRIDGKSKQSIEMEAEVRVTEYEKLTDDQLTAELKQIKED